MASTDILKVASLPGLEPEEQPTVREVGIEVGVKGSRDGKLLGTMGSQVEINKTAGQLASELRHLCTNCKHFDAVKAMAIFMAAEKTEEGRQELKHLRVNLLQLSGANLVSAIPSNPLDDFRGLGYCHAWSSAGNDMIVHPLGNCPTESEGWEDRWAPKDLDAEKRGDKAYDGILKRAEGKIE